MRDDDPLGYDTSHPDVIWHMTRDALTGKNREAVDAELAAIRRRHGGADRPAPWHKRVRRLLSQIYWRWWYWRDDRRIARTTDLFTLARDAGETDADYAYRCRILGCDSEGRRRFPRPPRRR